MEIVHRREEAAAGRTWGAGAATAFLLEASALLGQSLDHRATLAAVARLAADRLGVGCAVGLVEAGGVERLIAVPEGIAWPGPRPAPPGPEVAASGGLVYLAVPLRRGAHAVGALTLATTAAGRPRPADRPFLE